MPKILIRLCFLICCLFPQILLAQNLSQVIDLGNQRAASGDYFGAHRIYKTAMRIDSSDAEVLYRYGMNLKEINNPALASRYLYKSYLMTGDKVHADLSYELAEAYRQSGEYRKSRRYYSKALRPYRRDKKSYWYQRIGQSKKSAAWASARSKSKNTAELENFTEAENTSDSEFSGIVKDQVLYFSALRADSLSPSGAILDRNYYNRIYRMPLVGKSKALVVPFESKPQLAQKHLANFRFGKDKEVFFSVCDSNFQCEIWTGTYENQVVSKLKKLNSNINKSGFNNTQAQWFEQNQAEYLLFVSDREKGFGGLDLWLAKREDFGFEAPINLGGVINSPDNEISPQYQPKNNSLYFSSNWHIGYGGYDLFQSKGKLNQWSKPENMEKPINSSQDEYYFFPYDGKALLSSNRKLNNSDQEANCCNDLFRLNFEEDPFEEIDPEKMEVNVDVLNKYLPLDLYFHNDSPDPRSTDTTSEENYLSLAQDYQLMEEEYLSKYEKIFPDSTADEERFRLERFFDEDLNDGIKSLAFFSPLLLRELEKGSQIELTIKGYASSLSNSDYNLNLTLRRIQSLINYLEDYESAAFAPYLRGNSSNGGSLKINKLPFGEFAVENTSIESNRVTAIYSPEAARQRKIEVLAVTLNQTETTELNGSAANIESQLSIEQKEWNLGKLSGEQIERINIPVQNTGNGDLRIYTVNANCDCIEVRYPKEIKAGEKATIQVFLDHSEISGNANISLSIFSNTNPNIKELSIRFSK